MVNLKDNLEALVFITSELCNLNCKYCYIANSKNDPHSHYLQVHNNITQALKDKTYINNYITCLERLGVPKEKIKKIQLWGQEPTLNLEHFFVNFDYLYENFPNVNEVMFSTNGVDHIEKIINAMDIVDNIVDKPCRFELQFSVDGSEYTKINRGIDLSIILNNIKKLILELNNKKFQFLDISLHLHSVIGKNIFTTLHSQEEIDKYWIELNFINEELSKLNKNKKVFFVPILNPAIEQPVEATKEDGIALANFLYKSLQGPGRLSVLTIFAKIRNIYSHMNKYHAATYIDLIKILSTLDLSDSKRIQCFNSIKTNGTCGTQATGLKMGYDGTLYFCQNVMFQIREEDLDTEERFSDNYFSQLIKHKRYPNVLTSSDEELEKHFDFYEVYTNGALATKFTNAMNMLYLLSDCGQADRAYIYNKEKLMKDAMTATFIQNCPHADIIGTGSVYGRSLDLMRLFGNGALEIFNSYVHEVERSKNNVYTK